MWGTSVVPGSPKGTSRGALALAALIGAIVGAVVAAVVLVALDGDDDRAAERTPDVQAILERVQPSVVSISTGSDVGGRSGGVFGGPGSGVIISEDGLVLTNAHVVDGAPRADLTMHDGTTAEATLVGSLPENDIALLRIEGANGLTPAEIGSSADLVVGEPVVVLGNALNLGGPPSVTQGIVSALDRTIETPEGLVLDHLIQTDAAINLGNSGGAMVDAEGRLVGIPTAVINDAQSVGFAIAIDSVMPLVEEISSGGGDIVADSGFLGVSVVDLDSVVPAVLDEYGVEGDEGAFVSDLLEGSAAREAGIELGDVIVDVGGTTVVVATDVSRALEGARAGERVEVTFLRAGEERTVEVVLRARGETTG